jgi:UDP-2,3-diacylglucosamine hydrolase
MHELVADASWRVIELLSDVHLAPDMPATFRAWDAHLHETDADAVLMLGDVFEAWVGDDARFDTFESRCVATLAAVSKHRALYFIAGNRDFLVGEEMLRDAGVSGLPDPTLLIAFDQRILLTHGDALCRSDVDYQRFRAQVRAPQWQREFLARPLPERRRIAREMRDASAEHQRALPGGYSDVDTAAALQCMAEAQATILIHGHVHRPVSERLAKQAVRHVLSDWDHDHGSPRGDVLRLTADGVQRTVPAGQTRPR